MTSIDMTQTTTNRVAAAFIPPPQGEGGCERQRADGWGLPSTRITPHPVALRATTLPALRGGIGVRCGFLRHHPRGPMMPHLTNTPDRPMSAQVHLFMCLKDNFGVLLH